MAEDKLIEKYDNPTIRSLIQLVPFGIGSAIDVAISKTIEGIRIKRSQTFFDELSKGNIELTQETINNEEFLHSFFSTRKAAANTYRKEKIEIFARLFKNSIVNGDVGDTEEYEDYLKLVDQLSFKDMQLLIEIKRFETEYPDKRGKEQNLPFVEPMDVLPDWHGEMFKIMDTLNLSEPEFKLRLYRLTSIGLFERTIAVKNEMSVIDNPDYVGRLTPIANKIFELIN